MQAYFYMISKESIESMIWLPTYDWSVNNQEFYNSELIASYRTGTEYIGEGSFVLRRRRGVRDVVSIAPVYFDIQVSALVLVMPRDG